MAHHARVALVVLLLTLPAALATDEAGTGRWEILGEDGAIFVPDHHDPSASYLPPADLGAFHNASEMAAALQALAAAHPDLVTLEAIGTSVEGRTLWAVTLRAGADDGRPAVLFDGAHHGDEVIGSEILLRYAQALAAEYPATERSRAILENTTVVIVPMVNPDGISRAHNSTNYAVPRKNAHGVDLNRNYAATWGGVGSSGSPSSATYRGPTPASEPETQAMQTLFASRNWTFYSSLHSGAEMILWPYGHTTTPPAEAPAYRRLGDELTVLTQAPHGQVSVILYAVSGDSMDAAYLKAGPYWKPLSMSPETYEGSGHANDWWYLFNPGDGEIPTVVARWTKLLDHLATEAAHYAPATLTAPSAYDGPGAPFSVDATVRTPLKRPFVAGAATLHLPGFLDATSPNPVPIGALNGTRALAWSVDPNAGGSGVARVQVDAGPAGNITASFPVIVRAPSIELALAPTTVGSGQNFTATLRARTDAPLVGNVYLSWEGGIAHARAIELGAEGEETWTVTLNAGAAPAGVRPVTVTLEYVTTGGAGSLSQTKTVFVDRPSLVATRTGVPAASDAGSPFVMALSLRNVGTRAALATEVRETLPHGYAPWVRSASTIDPVARPAPTSIATDDEGRLVLTWKAGTVSPGGNYRIEIGLVPALPGSHTLSTSFDYAAQYPASAYVYEGTLETAHEVGLPG